MRAPCAALGIEGGRSVEWMHLSWQVIAWIILVTMLAGYIQGLLGVGYPMLATPLLSLMMDLRTAVIVTVPTIMFLSAYLIFRGGNLRESVARFWYMPLCMVVGALIGARIFLSVDPSWLLLALGLALLLYVALDWLGRANFPGARRVLHPGAVLCATLAGITEAAINVGGPFLLIWCLVMGLAPVTLIQVLNLCFLTGKTTQLIALTAGGIPPIAWIAAAPLAIAALLPFRLGIRMREHADVVAYRRWLRAFLSLMALLMIVRFARQAWL